MAQRPLKRGGEYLKKRPDITDSDERGKVASKTVGNVFAARPWVLNAWETVQNGDEDKQGHDMFFNATDDFLKMMKLEGTKNKIPVQIKSAERRIRVFVKKHSKTENRFFNTAKKYHQFVLCGMDDEEIVLADIVGQLVVHVSGFGMTEKEVLNALDAWGDKEAVIAYERNKVVLLFRWYGSRFGPLTKTDKKRYRDKK